MIQVALSSKVCHHDCAILGEVTHIASPFFFLLVFILFILILVWQWMCKLYIMAHAFNPRRFLEENQGLEDVLG